MFNVKRALVFAALLLCAAALALTLAAAAEVRQAERALAQARYDQAASAYLRAAKIFFWRDDLREAAALAALQNGDLSTAVYYLQRSHPSQRGTLALAYAYLQLGDLPAAQKTFEEGAARFPSADFYEGLALAYRSQNNWQAERGALERQIQLDASQARAHYRLGVLRSVLEADSALTELTRAAELDPQFDSAAQTLTAALNLSAAQPDSAKQKISIGRALGLVEEWRLAAFAFQQARDLDPQNAEAWAWLGEAHQHIGEPALADLNRALELGRASSIVRALRGLYWQRQGDSTRALAEYLLAAEYDPLNPQWQAALGGVYAQRGDLISALNSYQRAIALAPEESAYWRNLALFSAEYHIEIETLGLPAAQKAVNLAPADPQALDALGYLYYLANRYANAEAVLTQALKMAPQYLSAQIHLALNEMAQGKPSDAYARLVRVRDADADGADGALAARLLETYFP
ncbi:MAG: hypothetical protein Fur002_25690 [Anaerolineales bacterium]